LSFRSRWLGHTKNAGNILAGVAIYALPRIQFLSLAVMPFNAFVELMAAIIVTFAALVADVFAALGMLTGFMLLMFPALALLVLALALLVLALLVLAIAVIPPVVVVDSNNIIRSSCRNRRSFHSGSRPADQTKR